MSASKTKKIFQTRLYKFLEDYPSKKKIFNKFLPQNNFAGKQLKPSPLKISPLFFFF